MSVRFLDHATDKDGVRPLPEKLEIIREWKPLKMKLKLERLSEVIYRIKYCKPSWELLQR